jgi:hypothetical protein
VARPSFRLPDEAAGIDGIVQTLISVFDQADIIGLGEAHKVLAIVVEFGSTT